MSERTMHTVSNLANAGYITFQKGIWIFTDKGRDHFAAYITPGMSVLDFIDWLVLNASWVTAPAPLTNY
jgi:hypothetical protein